MRAPADGSTKHVLMAHGLLEMSSKRLRRQELRLSDFHPERDVSVDSGWFNSAWRVLAEV